MIFVVIGSKDQCSENQVLNHLLFVLDKDLVEGVGPQSGNKERVDLVKSVENRHVLYLVIWPCFHYLL